MLAAAQSVGESERIADLLRGFGIECVLLNARNITEETATILRTSEAGRVTALTQMARRDTDMVPSPKAVGADGLLVVGVGRFPSARLDDQLCGRAGRQGDLRESAFLTNPMDRLVTDSDPDHPDPAVVGDDGRVERYRANCHVLGVVDHTRWVNDGNQYSLRWLSWRYGELLHRQRVHLVEAYETRLGGPEALDRLAEHVLEEIAELGEQAGKNELEEGAQLTLVATINAAQNARFKHAAELCGDIHLRVLAREDPLTEFEEEMRAAYQSLSGRILGDAAAVLLEAPVVDGRLDLESLGSCIPSATWACTVTDNELGDDLTRTGRTLRRRLADRGQRLPALQGRCGVHLSCGRLLVLQRWRMTVRVAFPLGRLASDGRAGVEVVVADRGLDRCHAATPFGSLGDDPPTRAGTYNRLARGDHEGHRCSLRFRPSCAG